MPAIAEKTFDGVIPKGLEWMFMDILSVQVQGALEMDVGKMPPKKVRVRITLEEGEDDNGEPES